jgi:hypothetical protein
MSDFTRRPFGMGNTATPVHSQPEIRGSAAKDSSGEFPALTAVLPAEIAIETEDAATSGGISAVFSTDGTMVHVLAQINSALSGYATADEYEGCVRIKTDGSGEGSYIRIVAAISGFSDVANVLGFPVHPNPSATVSAGDLLDAPARPLQEVNPVGTKFLAAGEDRIGSAFNRALHQSGINQDHLFTWLKKPIIRLLDAEVDETTWASYFNLDADGQVDQINVSAAITALLPGEDGRVFVGKLTRLSTLEEIAQFFGVVDGDHNELMAGESIVRIGSITRGERGVARATFADATSAPSPALSDTSGIAVDGNSAAGVDREKHAAVQIDEIRQRTGVSCPTATFVTNGVAEGDVATISGSTVDLPFNHAAEYLVDVVVSETELILRPHHSSGHVRELNPDDSGNLGTIAITTGGEWETDIWVTLEPPLPRFPADGKIRLVLPMETALADLEPEDLAAGAIRAYEEVDGWVHLNLWREQNFGGVYQGMGHARGGGFRGEVTHHPVTFASRRGYGPSQGTTVRSSTGAASFNMETLRLTAYAADSFSLEDVGRTILLLSPATAAEMRDNEPWVIVRLVDGATVELAPPVHQAGYQNSGSVVIDSWEIREDFVGDIRSVLQAISPEYYGTADLDAAASGFLFWRQQRDEATTAPPEEGLLSFAHLEHIREHRSAGNITLFESSSISGNEIRLPFDPERSTNIVGYEGETRTPGRQGGSSFIRLLHGLNTGVYQIKKTTSAAGATAYDSVQVLNLDGSIPSFSAEIDISACLYHLRMGVGTSMESGPSVGGHSSASLSLFEDGHERALSFAAAMRAGWRGAGAGIYGYLNDPEFVSFDDGDGASGFFIDLTAYAPANGIRIQGAAAAAGAAARRQLQAITVSIESNFMDRALSDVDGLGGWAAWLGQEGKDPAVVVMRDPSRTPTSNTLENPAAIVAINDESSATTPRGIAGLAYLEGTIWHGVGPHVLETTGMTAGRWVTPSRGSRGGDIADPASEYTEDQGMTFLGSAPVVLPETTSATHWIEAALTQPDHSIFNFPHHGIAAIDSTLVDNAREDRLLGLGLEIVDDQGGGTLDGNIYLLIGRIPVAGGVVKFAFLNEDYSDLTADFATARVRVRGKRWFRGHVDIADWMQVGTQNAAENEEAPVLTSAPTTLEGQRNRTLTGGIKAEGGLTPILAVPVANGAGVGNALDFGSLTALQVSLATYQAAEAFVGASNDGSTVFEHLWGEEKFEPRTPFPNVGIISESSGQLDSTSPGDITVDDFALEFISGTTAHAEFSPNFAGSLKLVNTGGSGVDLRVWQRGVQVFAPQIYALKATLIYYYSGQISAAHSVTLELVTESGTVIASGSAQDHGQGGTEDSVNRVEEEFRLYDLLNESPDSFDYNALFEQGVHLVVHFENLAHYNSGDAEYHILQLQLEQLQRPALLLGDLQVGTVQSTGYRYRSPVSGFQTVGSAEVSLLHGQVYAGVYGNDAVESGTSDTAREWYEHKGVGALYTLDGVSGTPYWWKPAFTSSEFFRKSAWSASLSFYHPFFDPLWYAKVMDDIGGLSAANVVLPGQTGFVIPLNPPHGSRLSSAHWSLSVKPGESPYWYRSQVDPYPSKLGWKTHWGIWHSVPGDVSTNGDIADWEDESDWAAQAGVHIRIFRYNCLDFGVPHEPAYPGETPEGAEYGYPEEIWSEKFDFSGSPPSFFDNPVDEAAAQISGDDETYGSESFQKGQANLRSGGVEDRKLIVDRRHYAYVAVISCYGGPRDVRPLAPLSGNTGDWECSYDERTYVETVTVGSTDHQFHGFPMAFPRTFDSGDLPSQAVPDTAPTQRPWPPVLKFRGFRLGWVTDRAGHGGWG